MIQIHMPTVLYSTCCYVGIRYRCCNYDRANYSRGEDSAPCDGAATQKSEIHDRVRGRGNPRFW